MSQYTSLRDMTDWSSNVSNVISKEQLKVLGHSSRAKRMHHSTEKVNNCIINNQCEIQSERAILLVSNNNVCSLLIFAMLEELNTFIGNNQLLKRSFLLIKAWCNFESTRFTLNGLKECFSNDALVIMTIRLFINRAETNCYIEHPLDALVYFLADYSNLDWNSLAVTYSGVQPVGVGLCPELRTRNNSQTDRLDEPQTSRISTSRSSSETSQNNLFHDNQYHFQSNAPMVNSAPISTLFDRIALSTEGVTENELNRRNFKMRMEQIIAKYSAWAPLATSNVNTMESANERSNDAQLLMRNPSHIHSPPGFNEYSAFGENSFGFALPDGGAFKANPGMVGHIGEGIAQRPFYERGNHCVPQFSPSSAVFEMSQHNRPTNSFWNDAPEHQNGQGSQGSVRNGKSPSPQVIGMGRAIVNEVSNHLSGFVVRDPFTGKNLCNNPWKDDQSSTDQYMQQVVSVLKEGHQEMTKLLSVLLQQFNAPSTTETRTTINSHGNNLSLEGSLPRDIIYSNMRKFFFLTHSLAIQRRNIQLSPQQQNDHHGLNSNSWTNTKAINGSSDITDEMLRLVLMGCHNFIHNSDNVIRATHIQVSNRQTSVWSFDHLNASQPLIISYLRHVENVLSLKLTETAVINWTLQVLNANGPTAIGEVGKKLQIVSNNQDILKDIKKHFHGLKHFISNFPNIFRIGTDQYYNPTISIVDM